MHTGLLFCLRIVLAGVVLVKCVVCLAEAGFPITLTWPPDGPSLKFSFAKYQQSGLVNGQGIFVSDVIVENLSHQPFPKSVFTVFVMDKDGVRIGRGLLRLGEIAPKGTQRSQIQFSVAGTPVGLRMLSGRTVNLNVLSTPPGASLKIDGQDVGLTPKIVDFSIGAHVIELSKEGYAAVTTPLDVGADEVVGGSVSFELGGLSQDTVALRDGTTVLGDVMSLSLTAVVVRVDGKERKYDRNQVKKIILIERVTTQQTPVTQPLPAKRN